MKRKRLPSLKALRGRAHGLWSEIVRTLYPVCTVCGEKPSAQAHHLLSKRHFSSLRFAPRVGRGVCAGCHIKVHASPLLQVLAFSGALTGPEGVTRNHVDAAEMYALIRLFGQAERIKWGRANLTLIIVGLDEMLRTIKTGKEAA